MPGGVGLAFCFLPPVVPRVDAVAVDFGFAIKVRGVELGCLRDGVGVTRTAGGRVGVGFTPGI